MENVRKHRDIKLITTDRRRNQLVSQPNYYAMKRFSERFLAIKMNKTEVKKQVGLFAPINSRHKQDSHV